MKKIVIVGTGGLAREFTKFFSSHVEIVGYLSLDSKAHEEFKLPGKYFSDEKNLEKIGTKSAVIAIESPKIKRNLYKRMKEYGYVFPNFIHPSSIVESNFEKDKGLIVLPFCCVGPNVKFGIQNYINFSCGIGHDTEIGDFVQINTGVQIGGSSKFGNDILIGSGSIIRQGLKIGDRSTIGLGSVVMHEIKEDTTVLGNPAKKLKFHE